jgi:cyclophilin family peptidyl-prolyl cis-trans isomerase
MILNRQDAKKSPSRPGDPASWRIPGKGCSFFAQDSSKTNPDYRRSYTMNLLQLTRLAGAALLCVAVTTTHAADKKSASVYPMISITTTLGEIELELYPAKAPQTVKNFLQYVDKGFYNGSVFHRVIPGFMIQGGGFEPGMRLKPTGLPINNEADNGLKNVIGTIAMARTGDPHSAGAQFFINTADNAALDHTGKNPQGWGYCVFGKVTRGMEVVKQIESVPTGQVGPFGDVPRRDVVITRMERVKKGKTARESAKPAAVAPAK